MIRSGPIILNADAKPTWSECRKAAAKSTSDLAAIGR